MIKECDYNLSTKKLSSMSVEEKIKYFQEVKEYILNAPFDEEKLELGEKKFLSTLKLFVPPIKKIIQPNITSKLENLPEEPFILASNHLGSFDQILLSCAFPKTPFHYMIGESLLTIKNLYAGHLYVNRGAYVIDRTTQKGRWLAIPQSLQYVYRNRNIVIFPEGTRTIRYGSDGTVQEFKDSVIRTAQIANVPIVPVAINNNYKKGQAYINIGSEFRVGIEDDITEKNNELREEIIDLRQEIVDQGAIIKLAKKAKTK